MDAKFEELVSDLASDARKKKTTVHPSFAVELENYMQHVGVRTLDDEERELVAKIIVGDAIAQYPTLNGHAIRGAVNRRCRRAKDAYHLCAATALQILKLHNLNDAADRVKADMLESLKKYRK